MVVLAARSPEGFASALSIWGFVLTVIGVVLGLVGLRTAKPAVSSMPEVQVIQSQQGDAFGVQNGTMNVNRPSGSRAKQDDD